MEKQLVASKRALPSKKSASSSTPLDIFAVLRSRRKAWCAPELATLLNVGRRTVYQAATAGQLPAIRIGTSLRINPADALAWVEAGTTGLRSSRKEAM